MNIKIRRLVAFVIDFMLFFVFAAILRIIYIALFPTEKYWLICTILYYIPIAFVGLSADIIFGNESIGKKIMKLHIYDENDEIVTDKKFLFKRMLYSIFNPDNTFYIIMILKDNKSVGDKKMKTIVK